MASTNVQTNCLALTNFKKQTIQKQIYKHKSKEVYTRGLFIALQNYSMARWRVIFKRNPVLIMGMQIKACNKYLPLSAGQME